MTSLLSLVLLLVVDGIGASRPVARSATLGQTLDQELRTLWFSHANATLDLIRIGLNPSTPLASEKSSDKCRQHFQDLIDQTLKGELWANQMIDSMASIDSGVLKLSNSYLGSYSECLSAEPPESANFSPKYCLAKINVKTNDTDFVEKMMASVKTLSVKLGTCVPSSCGAQDITAMITRLTTHFLSHYSNSDLTTVSVNNCYEKEEQKITDDWPSLITIGVIALILIVVIVGTFCDHMTQDSNSQMELLFQPNIEALKSERPSDCYDNDYKSIFYELLIAFSLKANAKKIFDTKSVDNSIQVFHGIRVLAMVWIMGGHSVSFAALWLDFRNPLAIREVPQSIMSQLLANGTFSVDCFFFISGFLVSYLVMREMKKSDAKLNFPLFYIHRYLRMTPSMMAVIAFSATLLPYLASGPQWTESITMFNGWCRKNWWVNALYLHNFVNTENMCLSHSWYSAVDMQFYLISPFILIPLYRKPVVGMVLMALLLLVSMVITGSLTYAEQFPAVPYFNDVLQQAVVAKYYGWIYIKPYCRVGPYLVGIALAYAIYTSQGDIKIKRFYSILGWLTSCVVSLAVLFAMLPANNGHIPGVEMASLYSAVSRTVWALGLAWITFACITGYGSFINTFLSAKVWIPLSRLTHCAYLVHPIVIAVLYGSREQAIDFSCYLIAYFMIGHIVVTYAVSLLVSLLVESPFLSISKLLMRRKRTRNSWPNKTTISLIK